jgi:hypothetical protein
MPLKKLIFKPGINRERTDYTNEGGWFDCDKVRFRQGFPEKIGGWRRISASTFLGVCRSLLKWVTLDSVSHIGVGTNLKFYIEGGGIYNDVTPIRATTSLTNPINTTTGSTLIQVLDAAGGFVTGDFVTLSGAVDVGGIPAAAINKQHQLTVVGTNTYAIDVGVAATSTVTGGGGSVTAAYQINVGAEYAIPLVGWGAGGWGYGPWGVGESDENPLRLWSQSNFGEDLLFGPRGGGIYYWDASTGVGTRAVSLSTLSGASNVPTVQNHIIVSDISRFVFCMGCNDLGSSVQDPMLIRWSDQENAVDWTPAATNQAGGLRLSRGTEIVTAVQSRQEILVWTDSSFYSLQYLGGEEGWGAQLVGDNISIASPNAVAYANGVAYWMGRDKFYMYDGRTMPLSCDVRRFIFSDFNDRQYGQVFGGTNEAFHEIWWFYCSADQLEIDRYVVFNYLENTWYYGTMARTAWLDTGLQENPIAATYQRNIVNHEVGVDEDVDGTNQPIVAYITSTQFDIDDGDRFSFIWRVLPDITFRGSTTTVPTAQLTMIPMNNSGSGYNDPQSVGGVSSGVITRTATLPIQAFTQQLNIRVRGRQLILKLESGDLGVQWQLGSPRIDLRPDGRR